MGESGRTVLFQSMLKRYTALKLEEKQMLEQLEELEERAVSVNRTLDGMPRGSSISDPTARYAVKLVAVKDMITRKQCEIMETLLNVETAVESLNDPIQRCVMRGHYLNGEDFEQIALKMNYSVRHIFRIHKQALDCFTGENVHANLVEKVGGGNAH